MAKEGVSRAAQRGATACELAEFHAPTAMVCPPAPEDILLERTGAKVGSNKWLIQRTVLLKECGTEIQLLPVSEAPAVHFNT